eukprot:SAG25_NODE_14070_length_259_cov_0.918750_1_plen_63_part_10
MSSNCDRFVESKSKPSAIYEANWGGSSCTTCVETRTGSPVHADNGIFFEQPLNQDVRAIEFSV